MPGSLDLHVALLQQAVVMQDFDGVAVEDGHDGAGEVCKRCCRKE